MGSFDLKAEYDKALDITFVYPVGHLETEADCVAMYDAWVAVHDKQAPDSYFVAVMDMFSVDPLAMDLYLEYVRLVSPHNHGVCVVVNFSAADVRAVAENVDTVNGDCFFSGTIEDGVALIQRVRAERSRRPISAR